MINFLLIGDKNYNLQLVNSINSLCDNFDLINQNSTIYIIHKEPSSFKKYMKLLKYKNIKIIKFDKKYRVLNNVRGSHLSEVTYYRLYIDKLLNLKEGYLIYFDADLFFMNNVTNFFINSIEELSKSKNVVAAVNEDIVTDLNIDYFNKLDFTSKPYFNAGLIIFNLHKCFEKNFFNKLRSKLTSIDFELKYWDQDILNVVVNGEFLKMDEIINYGIDLKSNNFVPEGVLAVHYKGKNKPWDIEYAFNNDSKMYQDLHLANFDALHLTNIYKNLQKLKSLKIETGLLLKIIKIQFLKWI